MRMKKREKLVRYESLDAMPPPRPLSKAFREMSDAETERRAKADPDAGIVPPGFWKKRAGRVARAQAADHASARPGGDPLVQA